LTAAPARARARAGAEHAAETNAEATWTNAQIGLNDHVDSG
jgi:hypothetical protein